MKTSQDRQTAALDATCPVASGSARGLEALPLLLREKLISKKLMNKRQELRRMKNELLRTTADTQKRIEYKKRKKRMQQEIFWLENDLRRVVEGRQSPQAASESATGAMPDFQIG